jgi:hypothetical protein
MVRVFEKWLRDHPERLNESPSDLLFSALWGPFHCKLP